MANFTYATLTTAIQDYTEVGTSVFTSTITDQFIANAEERIFRDVNIDAYRYADVIIVDINLDVEKNSEIYGALIDFNVNLAFFKRAIATIGENCKQDVLILIETTVPPGTCREIVVTILKDCLKKRNLHNFDKTFIYKFPRMILSVVVMGIVLYLLLGFFSDKFDYNESWKFIYLFIIVIVSLISYFLISNFSGAFKFKDIKLK